MRKQSLRQTANLYLNTENQGSFKDKKRRAFVLMKIINDLHILHIAPPHWWALTLEHIHQLVVRWGQSKIKSATIMAYMTILRRFLDQINHPISDIDNQSLGLSRNRKTKYNQGITADIMPNILCPQSRLIMAIQIQFGLTFAEAIRVSPQIHFRDHYLWITREISFNSCDRMIPVRYDEQKQCLNELIAHLHGADSLIRRYRYESLRVQWRETLFSLNLPTNRSYRYLYARLLYHRLCPLLGNYQTCWLIRDEMGIASRNTLWSYLHE